MQKINLMPYRQWIFTSAIQKFLNQAVDVKQEVHERRLPDVASGTADPVS